jgi:hypothetical protein
MTEPFSESTGGRVATPAPTGGAAGVPAPARTHVGVYPEAGDAFDPDKLAQVRVHIGQALVAGGGFYVEYTSEWRTVCLHGGNAELCPQ